MGDVQLMFQLPKDILKLVRMGEAFISSGGVRDKSGKIIALAKPVMSKAANTAVKTIGQGAAKLVSGGALGTVSSLAANVQCAVIQKGVNQANVKLDILVEKFNQYEKAFNSIPNIQALSAVNLAVGLVNCAVTVAGFYMMNKKLDNFETLIKSVIAKIDYNKQSELLQEFDVLNAKSVFYLKELEENNCEIKDLKSVIGGDYIPKTYGLLNRIIREFESGELEGEFAFALIGKLSVIFARVLSEYSSRYMLENEEYPAGFEAYINLLQDIAGNEKFNAAVHEYVFSNTAELFPLDRKTIYLTNKSLIPFELEKMDAQHKTIELIGGKNINDYFSRLTNEVRAKSDSYYLDNLSGNAYVQL